MQYYTKQQLQGGLSYNPPCRLGNWAEDGNQDEAKLKDYLKSKAEGGLKLDVLRMRMERAMAPVAMTVIAADGYVHFGDILQLGSCKTGAALALDTEDTDPRPGEYACALSASLDTTPMARNTFLLVKYQLPKGAIPGGAYGPVYDDEVLHYGQKFSLVANSQAFGQPLDVQGGPDPWFVRSLSKSQDHYSKLAKHQEISATPRASYANVWQVIDPDPMARPLAEGAPVPVGAPFLLEHCQTRQCLNCEASKYSNDFGNEFEVSAHSGVNLSCQLEPRMTIAHDIWGKTEQDTSAAVGGMQTFRNHTAQVLVKESEGIPLSMIVKNLEPSNLWAFYSGSEVAQLPTATGQPLEKKRILKKILSSISKMGVNGLASMMRTFKEFDMDGSHSLSFDEFARAMVYLNVPLLPSELSVINSVFDKDGNGAIDFEEFAQTIKEIDSMS